MEIYELKLAAEMLQHKYEGKNIKITYVDKECIHTSDGKHHQISDLVYDWMIKYNR